MMIIPWRRSALLRKRNRLAVWRFGVLVGLNVDKGCFGFDGEVVLVSDTSPSCCSRASSEGRKRSFRPLRAISLRIFSLNHRTASTSTDRKRKTIKNIKASMLMIIPSLLRRSRRFLFSVGNGITHGRVGLDVFHAIIVHDAQIALSKGFRHRARNFGFRLNHSRTHFLF